MAKPIVVVVSQAGIRGATGPVGPTGPSGAEGSPTLIDGGKP